VADVQRFSDVHCFLANDANMAALGEFRFGEDIPYENMTLITLGTGVGGGAVVNRKLFRGNISPCEIGHITIVVDGRRCGCGSIFYYVEEMPCSMLQFRGKKPLL